MMAFFSLPIIPAVQVLMSTSAVEEMANGAEEPPNPVTPVAVPIVDAQNQPTLLKKSQPVQGLYTPTAFQVDSDRTPSD